MAAAVNTVGAKGSADSSTSLTTSSVTPTGSNTAVLVFTLGESTGYASGSNFNSSGGTAINDFTSADVHLNVATNFRQAYGKVFGEVASPTSSTAIYALFPAAGNSIVVESVFLDTVDQATPFGTEQVSAETALSGTQTVSRTFSGLTSGQLVVGALFIEDFAGSASTATANSGTTSLDMVTSPGPENDVLTIYVVSTVADGSGNATLSMDATSTAAFSCARMWGVPVVGATGGGPTYTLDATGGTYSYSGAAAGLVFGRVLGATGGTYAYSGTAANLLRGFNLAASGGVYSYSGTAAALTAGRVLPAAGATYAYTGQDATLTYSPANTYVLVAGGGTYSYTGPNVTFTTGRVLAAASADYSYAGGAANLVYSGNQPIIIFDGHDGGKDPKKKRKPEYQEYQEKKKRLRESIEAAFPQAAPKEVTKAVKAVVIKAEAVSEFDTQMQEAARMLPILEKALESAQDEEDLLNILL